MTKRSAKPSQSAHDATLIADVQKRIAVFDRHHRRQGIGTRLYARAAALACRRFHLPLASNVLRSEDSEAFWQRQVRKGRARCLQWESGPAQTGKPCAEYVLSCPPPRSLQGR